MISSNQIKMHIDTNRELEFVYNKKKYTITYSKNKEGKKTISFGELYSIHEEYDSFEHLMNDARIENSYLRFMLDDLALSN